MHLGAFAFHVLTNSKPSRTYRFGHRVPMATGVTFLCAFALGHTTSGRGKPGTAVRYHKKKTGVRPQSENPSNL